MAALGAALGILTNALRVCLIVTVDLSGDTDGPYWPRPHTVAGTGLNPGCIAVPCEQAEAGSLDRAAAPHPLATETVKSTRFAIIELVSNHRPALYSPAVTNKNNV